MKLLLITLSISLLSGCNNINIKAWLNTFFMHSTEVRLINNSTSTLTLYRSSTDAEQWLSPPPKIIPANKAIRIVIHAKKLRGTKGWVAYHTKDGVILTFCWKNSFILQNAYAEKTTQSAFHLIRSGGIGNNASVAWRIINNN